MDILEKHIVHQQEEMIKIQILLHALVDELIESNLINGESLDKRIKQKIKVVNNIVDSQIKELQLNNVDLSNIFNGPMGEA